MYEHLRNELLLDLSKRFDAVSLDLIMSSLDRIASNYTVTERETQLAVIEDEIPRLVKIFLSSKKLEGASDETIKLYRYGLRAFFDMVESPPQDICTNEIRIFLVKYKEQRGISDRTIDKYRQIINGFFEWCVNEEYLTKNPCKNIKEIKFEVEPRHSLTRMQLEKLRRLCKNKRDLAIVDVLYSTGCRVRELVNMRFEDTDFNENTVRIIGKGKKHNTVYLNTNAMLSLEAYLKERKDDSDYLFVSERKPHTQLTTRTVQHLFSQLETLLRENGERGVVLTPHVMRHTTATLGLQNGMKITEVQKMLNHSSVNTTMIYAETSQDDLATAHRRFVI